MQKKIFEDCLFTAKELSEEVLYLKDLLADTSSPVVFCHNDLLPFNMVMKKDSSVVLIDLEYSGPNHAAFDIATHFNLCVGCEDPLDYKKNYPNEYLMRDWIATYLTEYLGAKPSMVNSFKVIS